MWLVVKRAMINLDNVAIIEKDIRDKKILLVGMSGTQTTVTFDNVEDCEDSYRVIYDRLVLKEQILINFTEKENPK